MPLLIRKPEEMQAWREKNVDKSVGFVPTMGALHFGHETLLQRARLENDLCVLSIFVNPTQFNDKKDFEKYPQNWEQDLRVADQNKVDVVFAPNFDLMYPDHYRFKLMETDFSQKLCGADRPGHFDGVLSIVMKLFLVLQPTRAYFGEKDFQQLTLIQDMVKSFFLPVEIVAVPTVREKDGLAMSSRNVRLSPDQRSLVPLIFKTISTSASALEAQKVLEAQGWKVDYLTDLNGRRFVAVRVGDVRLIDNVAL